MEERAQHGEAFGFIAAIGLLYKAGTLSRERVKELFVENHITREDLQKFKKQTEPMNES